MDPKTKDYNEHVKSAPVSSSPFLRADRTTDKAPRAPDKPPASRPSAQIPQNNYPVNGKPMHEPAPHTPVQTQHGNQPVSVGFQTPNFVVDSKYATPEQTARPLEAISRALPGNSPSFVAEQIAREDKSGGASAEPLSPISEPNTTLMSSTNGNDKTPGYVVHAEEPISLAEWQSRVAAEHLPKASAGADNKVSTSNQDESQAPSQREGHGRAGREEEGRSQTEMEEWDEGVTDRTSEIETRHPMQSEEPQVQRVKYERPQYPGPTGGIQAVMAAMWEEGERHVVVEEVAGGGQLERKGVRPGNRLLKIDDEPTEGMPLDEVAGRIEGPDGSLIKLELLAPSQSADFFEGDPYTVAVMRTPSQASDALAGVYEFLDRLIRGSVDSPPQIPPDLQVSRAVMQMQDKVHTDILMLKHSQADLLAEKSRMASEIAMRERDNRQLHEDLSAAEQDARALQQSSLSMQRREAQLLSSRAEFEARTQETVQEVRAQLERTQQELEAARYELDSDVRVHALEDRKQGLQAEIERHAANNAKLQQLLELERTRSRKLENNIKHIRADMSKLEEQVIFLRSNQDTLQRQSENLATRLQGARMREEHFKTVIQRSVLTSKNEPDYHGMNVVNHDEDLDPAALCWGPWSSEVLAASALNQRDFDEAEAQLQEEETTMKAREEIALKRDLELVKKVEEEERDKKRREQEAIKELDRDWEEHRREVHKIQGTVDPGPAVVPSPKTFDVEVERAAPIESEGSPPPENNSQDLVGVGIYMASPWTVMAMKPGSSAARMGLQAGDIVQAIDGVTTKELRGDDVARMLLGAPSTTVRLTVHRMFSAAESAE